MSSTKRGPSHPAPPRHFNVSGTNTVRRRALPSRDAAEVRGLDADVPDRESQREQRRREARGGGDGVLGTPISPLAARIGGAGLAATAVLAGGIALLAHGGGDAPAAAHPAAHGIAVPMSQVGPGIRGVSGTATLKRDGDAFLLTTHVNLPHRRFAAFLASRRSRRYLRGNDRYGQLVMSSPSTATTMRVTLKSLADAQILAVYTPVALKPLAHQHAKRRGARAVLSLDVGELLQRSGVVH